MDLIERLEKLIQEQNRNGRNMIYVSIEDLEELGYRNLDVRGAEAEGKQFIDLATLKSLMKRYMFRYNLKSRLERTEGAVSESCNRVKESRKIIDNSWDSIEK